MCLEDWRFAAGWHELQNQSTECRKPDRHAKAVQIFNAQFVRRTASFLAFLLPPALSTNLLYYVVSRLSILFGTFATKARPLSVPWQEQDTAGVLA